MQGSTSQDDIRTIWGDVDDGVLLTVEQVALLLGLSHLTLRQWRAIRKGPDYTRIGPSVVRYRASAIRAYLAGLPAVSAADPRAGNIPKKPMPRRPTRAEIAAAKAAAAGDDMGLAPVHAAA